MKKLLIAVLAFATLTTSVSAWQCEAESAYAYGMGFGYSIYQAKSIALNECAMRTPYGFQCRIINCW